MSNHVAEHMGPALAEAGLTVAQSLLANLVYLSNEILDLLEVAKGKKSLMAAAALIGTAQKNAELIAKITGVLDERPQVNILVLPQWLAIEQLLLEILDAQQRDAFRAKVAALAE